MSDEIKAAAERRRKWRETHRGWYRQDMDSSILADAYLAEHPADDDEPVMEAWLRAVGFENCSFPDHGKPLCIRFMRDCLFAVYTNGVTLISIRGMYAPASAVRTRGHVRRVCRALGVELKESKESPA